MLRVGITGQKGFIGTHLSNTIMCRREKYELVDFQAGFFDSTDSLQEFVKKCDVIVHLAAKNRHSDPEVIFNTNIALVDKVIDACSATSSTPHILFSSSTQEERDNTYGNSKRIGREKFEAWAKKNNARFSGLVIPNVFGAFGNAYYNSVVATFCHQLTHNEQPKIDIDGDMKLIYVQELITEMLNIIDSTDSKIQKVNIPHKHEIKVSALLEKLQEIKNDYFSQGIIPDLENKFTKNLFLTFLTYIDHKSFYPFKLTKHTDARGSFIEINRLNSGGQVSFSTTVPEITRGNHFHTRKAERFTVIKGKALIEIRKVNTNEKISFELNGDEPSFVDMPIWYTHNIKNIGTETLYTMFWINEFFDQKDPDTYMEVV
jgi:UDP-2-acetamido-2,6-beta-L-arabino-hexul-4-ose reductase